MHYKNEEYLMLFANCRSVSGFKKAILCDLQRDSFFETPLSFAYFIEQHNRSKISEIISCYSESDKKIVNEYLEFIFENELGFTTTNPEFYPDMDMYWQEPSVITNAIIDFRFGTYVSESHIIELKKFGCKSLQLRFAEKLNLEYIATIVNQFCNFGFDSIELLIDHNQFTDIELNNKIVIPFPTVSIIIVANSPKNEYYHYQPNNFGHIFYTDQKYDTHLSCGNISKNFFTTNLKTFTESLQYNSCLNRKISIDIDGNIKNCPSMKQSFGNIKDTTLEEAINKRGFKKYWNINKDKIKVCQDCEFRYICTDCRAYVEDPKDNYSKPLKCGYDPYTGEWSEWSTNPLKQKAIKYYGMEDLIVKNSGNTKDA